MVQELRLVQRCIQYVQVDVPQRNLQSKNLSRYIQTITDHMTKYVMHAIKRQEWKESKRQNSTDQLQL